MNILDELKKKQFVHIPKEAIRQVGDYAVHLSDIEEVLSKATCENCKWCIEEDRPTSPYMFCNNNNSFVQSIFYEMTKEFGCNQFESKEVKNG